MPFDLITLLRITQALLSLLSLALNASVIHFFNTHKFIGSAPGYLPFLTFTGVWTLLISIPYTTFAPPYFPAYINRYASLAFELVTTIFWFAGFIAGAVWLGTIDVCAGLICNNARAGVVFAALVWVCFCVTSYFPVKYCFFDGDNAQGESNWNLGMSGAERIKRTRMRREKNEMVDFRAERDEEDGGKGLMARMKRGVGEVMEIVQVRTENVIAEWRTKTGRNGPADANSAPAEMVQREQRDGGVDLAGSRNHGYEGRNFGSQGGNMV